ncbi:hypothetical protein WA158_002230 [Blastocystis sp. Blastoise]
MYSFVSADTTPSIPFVDEVINKTVSGVDILPAITKLLNHDSKAIKDALNDITSYYTQIVLMLIPAMIILVVAIIGFLSVCLRSCGCCCKSRPSLVQTITGYDKIEQWSSCLCTFLYSLVCICIMVLFYCYTYTMTNYYTTGVSVPITFINLLYNRSSDLVTSVSTVQSTAVEQVTCVDNYFTVDETSIATGKATYDQYNTIFVSNFTPRYYPSNCDYYNHNCITSESLNSLYYKVHNYTERFISTDEQRLLEDGVFLSKYNADTISSYFSSFYSFMQFAQSLLDMIIQYIQSYLNILKQPESIPIPEILRYCFMGISIYVLLFTILPQLFTFISFTGCYSTTFGFSMCLLSPCLLFFALLSGILFPVALVNTDVCLLETDVLNNKYPDIMNNQVIKIANSIFKDNSYISSVVDMSLITDRLTCPYITRDKSSTTTQLSNDIQSDITAFTAFLSNLHDDCSTSLNTLNTYISSTHLYNDLSFIPFTSDNLCNPMDDPDPYTFIQSVFIRSPSIDPIIINQWAYSCSRQLANEELQKIVPFINQPFKQYVASIGNYQDILNTLHSSISSTSCNCINPIVQSISDLNQFDCGDKKCEDISNTYNSIQSTYCNNSVTILVYLSCGLFIFVIILLCFTCSGLKTKERMGYKSIRTQLAIREKKLLAVK